jgi:hypothetical protein
MEWQLADFADDSALWGFDAIHLPASWLALVKSSRPINEGSAVPRHRAHRSSTEAMYSRTRPRRLCPENIG